MHLIPLTLYSQGRASSDQAEVGDLAFAKYLELSAMGFRLCGELDFDGDEYVFRVAIEDPSLRSEFDYCEAPNDREKSDEAISTLLLRFNRGRAEEWRREVA